MDYTVVSHPGQVFVHVARLLIMWCYTCTGAWHIKWHVWGFSDSSDLIEKSFTLTFLPFSIYTKYTHVCTSSKACTVRKI